MNKTQTSHSGSFHPRIFAAFMLSCAGGALAVASLAMPQSMTEIAASSGGARIYVTTTTPKIGPSAIPLLKRAA